MVKKAKFRFYEELNDFLPETKRKLTFTHEFKGTPSVKDVIEAIGVPHVEIDLILVNSEPVNFNYILKDNDQVSVYPVFETLDISQVMRLRQKPLRETKFILDVHLGKLAKYLRMFGFDTLYQNNYSDKDIISISITEHRIILTRDIGLLKVKIVTHGYFIRNDIPEEQIKEVLDHFDLYQLINPFARCLKCNGLLEKVQKDEVLPQLQKLTIMYFNDFLKCKNCQRVYWDGSHYDRMKTFIESIINSKFNASNQKG